MGAGSRHGRDQEWAEPTASRRCCASASDNPLQKKAEAFTIALLDPDSEVLIDQRLVLQDGRAGSNEARTHPNRLGPALDMHCVLLSSRRFSSGRATSTSSTPQSAAVTSISSHEGRTTPPHRSHDRGFAAAEPKQATQAAHPAQQASMRLAGNLHNKHSTLRCSECAVSGQRRRPKLAVAAALYARWTDYTNSYSRSSPFCSQRSSDAPFSAPTCAP